MTGSFSAEHIEELLTGYVLGDLSPEEAEALQQLLAERPELRGELAQLQEAIASVPYDLPQVAPPPRLKTAILAATQQTQPSQNRDRPAQRYRWPWSSLVASVAAVVALAVGIDNYRLRQDLQKLRSQVTQQSEIATVLQQPRSRLVSLQGVGSSEAVGSIVLAPSQDKLVIVVQQLPPLSAEQIYRLWAVIGDQKIACGQFNASGKGTVTNSLVLPTEACKVQNAKLVVTQEPFPPPPQPVGQPVLISQ
jgi:anti-sigma-K factor RskA